MSVLEGEKRGKYRISIPIIILKKFYIVGHTVVGNTVVDTLESALKVMGCSVEEIERVLFQKVLVLDVVGIKVIVVVGIKVVDVVKPYLLWRIKEIIALLLLCVVDGI